MSINEEPKSATEPAGGLDDDSTIIDLDDVEGHGMREVAAGLGAAAVLAGGGTAAVAAGFDVHPSLPQVKASTPSVSDPIGTVDRATDRGIQISREVRDAALDTAGRTAAGAAAAAGQQVSATSATAANLAGGAQRTADAFVEAGSALAAKEVRAAGATARAAVSSAGAVVSGTQTTASTAAQTASSAAAGATSTASAATTDAVRKAATVLQLTTSTVSALETTVIATVETLNPELRAGTSGMGSSGWVTFSLGGENIASVQVSNGQATVTVKTSSLGGKVLQAVYSGDALNASSMRTLTL